MKHAGDLFEALKAGKLDDATKYLRTYGSTLGRSDKDTDTGCHSIIAISYYTRRFVLTMHNGNTLSIAVDGETYTK